MTGASSSPGSVSDWAVGLVLALASGACVWPARRRGGEGVGRVVELRALTACRRTARRQNRPASFIGVAFIFKKKGLIKAGGGLAQIYKSPVWVTGVVLREPPESRVQHHLSLPPSPPPPAPPFFLRFTARAHSAATRPELARQVAIGEALNFAAYAFAPALLVTPVGAVSVVIR
ncbi:MAG: hypothetical protein BJ554DRAFT_4749 [Olpidium bornovanus]|uniref:Uncharacterized protein n=1 Tax=Olpidium bornovanus TaxID=278681 RepID=A0A8H8DLS4_9FUNG|nr:MAG: hypothetical protein BJ554DRAFT_4749 [Olpidium bornovanus]